MSDAMRRIRSTLDNRPKGFVAVSVDVADLEAVLVRHIAVARKCGNYRRGIKQLQRAHELVLAAYSASITRSMRDADELRRLKTIPPPERGKLSNIVADLRAAGISALPPEEPT